jgi:hypothetical protein
MSVNTGAEVKKPVVEGELDIEKLKAEITDHGKRKIILTAIFLSCFIGFTILVYSSPHLTE